MRQLLFLVPIVFAFCSSHGQAFSGKSNSLKIDYTRPIATSTVPVIIWAVPRAELSISASRTVAIEASVKSDIALKSVLIEVINGEDKRTKQVALGENELIKVISQTLNLPDGDNEIRIVVENVRGIEVSSTRSVISGNDALELAVDANRKDYALVFATDKYDHWDDLTNPVNDSRAIAEILKDKYGFQVEIVENATSEEVMSKIFDYNLKTFHPQDQLFVFFAGHGAFDQTLGEGYVVASNSLPNDKGRTTYISHLLIRERLNNIKCNHIFLMMDVCFGGTIDPVLAKARAGEDMSDRVDKQYLVKKLTKTTRKFLTSGSKEYVPDGTPGKHSPFAEKFILALKEVGGGEGRILSLLELRPYFLRLQTEPRFGSFGTDDPASDFVFVLKTN